MRKTGKEATKRLNWLTVAYQLAELASPARSEVAWFLASNTLIRFYLSICLSVCLSVYLSICLSLKVDGYGGAGLTVWSHHADVIFV